MEKKNTRICEKKFIVLGGKLNGICTCIDVYKNLLGGLITNDNKNHKLRLINLKTNEAILYKHVLVGSNQSTYIKLFENYVIICNCSVINIYKYSWSSMKLITQFNNTSYQHENIFINNKNQLIILYNKKFNIYSECDKTKLEKSIDICEHTSINIDINTFKYDNDKNVYYIGGLFGNNFNVMDESFNVIHSDIFDVEEKTHKINKINIYKNRLYLTCQNYTKEYEKNEKGELVKKKYCGSYRYYGGKDKNRSVCTIIILDRNTYKVISKHYFNDIDTKFLCFVKNLIIYKLNEQMNHNHKMIVYDINDSEDVKKIKLDVLWEWEPYRGEWENDWIDVPEYGNIVNYNDEKIIIIGNNGLLYFKLR